MTIFKTFAMMLLLTADTTAAQVAVSFARQCAKVIITGHRDKQHQHR